MRVFEEINALRFLKPFIEAVGGMKQVRLAVKWGVWYAVKWWDEIYREIGLDSIRSSIFARALFLSLRQRGNIDAQGRMVKSVNRPELPTNSYALEFVDLHESFDRLGAVNIAYNHVDENIVDVLMSTMLSQGWYRILRRTFLELVEIQRYGAVVEPIVKEGFVMLQVFEIYRPKLYFAYDYRRDSVELAASLAGVKPGSCENNICIYHALSACDLIQEFRKAAPEGADAVLTLHTLYWMVDPVKELTCLRSMLKKGGKLLIGQMVIESTPGIVAITAAMGSKHVLSWQGVERVLKAAGYSLLRRYVRCTPYYAAVWAPASGQLLSKLEPW